MSLLLMALLLTLAPSNNANLHRRYWPCSIKNLSSGNCPHTHVEVSGQVTLVKYEADGDTHIRIEDNAKHFVVAECIPLLFCSLTPKKGQLVTVRGISRKDPDHGWYEVHPVEMLF